MLQTLISQAALTYDEVVHEVMHAEGQFIRDLNMIIKVVPYRIIFTVTRDYYKSPPLLDIKMIFRLK